jgi:hypothetical protein
MLDDEFSHISRVAASRIIQGNLVGVCGDERLDDCDALRSLLTSALIN